MAQYSDQAITEMLNSHLLVGRQIGSGIVPAVISFLLCYLQPAEGTKYRKVPRNVLIIF